MKKIKSIVLCFSMFILFAVCVQIYLILEMGNFGFANMFFYGILFMTFYFMAIWAYKKKNFFVIICIVFMFAFMFVKFHFNRIENYYFNRTISNGNIIKADLKRYHNSYKVFPESLKEVYRNSDAPQYNIGFFRYDFGYYKVDTSYELYFNHFKGRTFRNKGESDVWNYYD